VADAQVASSTRADERRQLDRIAIWPRSGPGDPDRPIINAFIVNDAKSWLGRCPVLAVFSPPRAHSSP
jgi:hypothetical protein